MRLPMAVPPLSVVPPSHGRMTMSYRLRVSRLFHRRDAGGSGGDLSSPFERYRSMCPLELGPPGVNSESSTPSLRSKHSMGSWEPVATAKYGRSPSTRLRGNRVTAWSSVTVLQDSA